MTLFFKDTFEEGNNRKSKWTSNTFSISPQSTSTNLGIWLKFKCNDRKQLSNSLFPRFPKYQKYKFPKYQKYKKQKKSKQKKQKKPAGINDHFCKNNFIIKIPYVFFFQRNLNFALHLKFLFLRTFSLAISYKFLKFFK